MAAKAGFSVNFGPTNSPWANGINERNHATADRIVQKIMDTDPEIKLKEAVAMAAWTHNTNVNKLGYSPLQLVTGKAVKIPGLTMGNEATDSQFNSEVVKKIMERHFALMKEFAVEEYTSKIKQVIETPRRSYQNVK